MSPLGQIESCARATGSMLMSAHCAVLEHYVSKACAACTRGSRGESLRLINWLDLQNFEVRNSSLASVQVILSKQAYAKFPEQLSFR